MTRTPDEIRQEMKRFDAQFIAPRIPAGTPGRKQLQREADAAAHAEACKPEHVKYRVALLDELRKAVANEKRRATMAAKAADPQEQARRFAMKWLRRLGFQREGRTGSGSTYYELGACRVRISDHDVPLTAERQHNIDHGGFSWATHGWTLRVDDGCMSVARDLVAIRREVKNA